MAVFFTLTGYAIRDHQQYERSETYTDVLVLRQNAPNTYEVRIAGQTWDWKFCDSVAPRFQPGMVIEAIRFEDTGECKNLAGSNFGYKVRRDRQGNPILEASADGEW